MTVALRFWPALLVLGAIWFGWDGARSAARLREVSLELQHARAALEAAEVAAAVHRAHLSRAADERRAFLALQQKLHIMEGGDEALSGYLNSAAGLLWPEQ